MPFIRTPKGTKIAFSQARLSALISLVYMDAMGQDKTPRYRGDIQQHCQRIWKNLEELYGHQDDSEWPGSLIQQTIEKDLREYASVEVHEAFVSMKINEFQSSSDARFDKKRSSSQSPAKTSPQKSDDPYQWNRFEPKPNRPHPMAVLDQDQLDPIWGIVFKNSSPKEKEAVNDADDQNLFSKSNPQISVDFDDLGAPARLGAQLPRKKPSGFIAPIRRSQWLEFWKDLPKKHTAWFVWEKHIMSIEPDQQTKDLAGWWRWWQDQIDQCLKKDPRVYELRRALHERKKRADIAGQHWSHGTVLSPDVPFRLEVGPTGNSWYRRFAVEHLKRVFSKSASDVAWDWAAINRALAPERDALLTWKAWQHLDESGSLHRLIDHTESSEVVWSNNTSALPEATEMPQWAWMRLAMAMASFDPDQSRPTQNAIELYDYISQLILIPSSSSVRAAGSSNPRFFEDHTWMVPDQFDGIQKVIYSAAVDTIWTGTSNSVWSHVRSKNAPVRSGRRKSTGCNDFLRTIDAHLKAQGRMGEDRPVSVMMPIWHLDTPEFMGLRHENGQRLQPIVLLSDLFMQRVAENGVWTFFDPFIYPEVKSNTKEGYLAAEQAVSLRKKSHPNAHKSVSADRFWKKMLNHMRLGSPFVTFADSDKAFSPNPEKFIHGVDGVGSFPIARRFLASSSSHGALDAEQAERVEWPAMAINIAALMGDQGEPKLDQWREAITWAFWMAERMYDACENDLSIQTKMVRPMCLGVVGFYEAIQKAIFGSKDDPEAVAQWVAKIGEAWSTLTVVVDQVFCQKYGPAPIWNDQSNHLNSWLPFHPQHCYDRLKKQRSGGLGALPPPEKIGELFDQVKQHRFSVRTVWAPFRQAATWAGVSPGGFGTLFPVEWVIDDDRVWRLTPTSYLLSEMDMGDGKNDYGQIFEHPENPNRWPDAVKKMCAPDMVEWKNRLHHAAVIRPWVEQGVSLTLPAGMPSAQLSMLIQQAWWLGLSNIRFEDPFKKPDQSVMGADGVLMDGANLDDQPLE